MMTKSLYILKLDRVLSLLYRSVQTRGSYLSSIYNIKLIINIEVPNPDPLYTLYVLSIKIIEMEPMTSLVYMSVPIESQW